MTEEKAKQFAEELINAWNRHDMDSILQHYADELEYFSPMIAFLKFNNDWTVKNKADLEKYFNIGLAAYPDLPKRYIVLINSKFLVVNTIN